MAVEDGSRISGSGVLTADDTLKWIELKKEIDDKTSGDGTYVITPETLKERFFNRMRENPLVPIGALITAGVLTAGLRTVKTGNIKLSQKLMRARVAAQGLTLGVMALGILYQQFKRKGS